MVLFATPETPPLALGQLLASPIWVVYRAAGRTVAITWAAACLRLGLPAVDHPSFTRNRLPHTVRWSTRPVLTLLDTVALHHGQQ